MLSIIFIVSVFLEVLVVRHLANAYVTSADSPKALYEEGFQVGPFAGRQNFYQDLSAIGTSAGFNGVSPVAFERTEKFAIVASSDGKKIRKIDLRTKFVGVDITPSHDWHFPSGIVVSRSNSAIYVSDRHLIARINNFDVSAVAGTENYVVDEIAGYIAQGFVDGDGAVARFAGPKFIDIDSSDRFLYVSDVFNNKIRRVDLTSATYAVDTFYTSDVKLGGIVVDSTSSFLYVASSDSAIYRISIASNPVAVRLTTINANNDRLVDGRIRTSKFSSPSDIDIDEKDNLYVFDNWSESITDQNGQEMWTYSSAIRRIDTKNGLTSTIAGALHGDDVKFLDGPGTNAAISNSPSGSYSAQLAVSKMGNKILLTDYENNIVREISCLDGYTIAYGQCSKPKVKVAATKKPTKQ